MISHKKTASLLLIVIFSACAVAAFAQGAPSEPPESRPKGRFILAPFVFYTPETRVAFGAAASFLFNTASRSQNTTSVSTISPLLIYTVRGQINAALNGDIYFPENRHRLNISLRFKKFPDSFYGLGPNVRESDQEDFSSRSFELLGAFYRRIAPSINIGIQYHLFSWDIVETAPGGKLDTLDIPGAGNGFISGFGLILNRDTRDNIYAPYGGEYYEINARHYPEFLSAPFAFSSLTLDLRRYFTLSGSHIAAFQVLLQSQGGRVPFLNLAQMGGPNVMRGYYEGRFRDKHVSVVQAEYRFPLSGRFRGVVFAGVGKVAHTFSDLDLKQLQFSWGGGLRFLIDKKERIYMRMDVGFGKDSKGFYFGIFEAF